MLLQPQTLQAAPLVYAASWWNEATYARAMSDRSAPIWRNLSAQRTEAYRDLCELRLTTLPAELAAAFGMRAEETVWARHYVLYCGGEPLCVVYEAFNPGPLAALLGDSDGREGAAALEMER